MGQPEGRADWCGERTELAKEYFMFGLGLGELIVVLVVLLLLFSRRLPELGHSLGKSINKFRKAMRESGEIDITPEDATKNEKRSPDDS